MSLWTPYAEEALDLSRPVKKERVSPALSPQDHQPCLLYRYEATQPAVAYAYQQDSVPSPAVSPESVSGWSKPAPADSPSLYDLDSISEDVEYQAFERDALRALAAKNGGSLLGNNPRMRRAVQASGGGGAGQPANHSYRKQRERNNVAAKQSRDRRKLREVRLAFQVSFLQKKLAGLRARLAGGAERCCARCHQHYPC